MNDEQRVTIEQYLEGGISKDAASVRDAVKALYDEQKAEKFSGTSPLKQTHENLSRLDLFAIELAKVYIAQDYEGPCTKACENAQFMINKLDGKE